MDPKMDLELRLGYLIHDVSRLRRTLFDKWLSPLGITRSQWWVLAFLSRNDGMPQTELALELDVGKVALGALIDRLEQGGFVKRTLDPSDRRVKRIVLTKQSKELLETLRGRNSQFNKRILKGISHGHLEITAETLRLMKHNLRDEAQNFSAEAVEASGGQLAVAPPPAPAASARRPRVRTL